MLLNTARNSLQTFSYPILKNESRAWTNSSSSFQYTTTPYLKNGEVFIKTTISHDQRGEIGFFNEIATDEILFEDFESDFKYYRSCIMAVGND